MEYIIAKKDNVPTKVRILDIFYISTVPEKPRVIQLVTEDGVYERYGKIKDYEVSAALFLTKCHRKYLVNLKHVRAIDIDHRRLIFETDSIDPIECSRRNFVEVMSKWQFT